ncbi:hypothetical protein E2N92_13375 [Methanofollis formosanus]|uniref:Uncharacterized protein n=1 Tax=Methanofollis formosanus TaxID=299308 RepID=A0A8G1A3E8_9EURY|nr:hypothetical protein [Methanofollis formosanus]QYZ80345.1 hypothetical protein E2N92_13375 [Methanofollis formosanus]
MHEPDQDEIIRALSEELVARARDGGQNPGVPFEETTAFKQFVASTQAQTVADTVAQVDYDLVIDEIVAEIPNGLIPIGNVEAVCPYCGKSLKKKPLKKTKCPACRNEIQVMRRPADGLRVLVTDEQVEDLEIQAFVEAGEYDKQIWLLKERMKKIRASGEQFWRCDAGIDAQVVPYEALCMHGKVVAVGSPEELEVLTILSAPGCIGMPVQIQGDRGFDPMDEIYASQRYERALEILQCLPKSRKNSEYAQKLRRMLG